MATKTLRIPLFGSLINRNVNPNAFATQDQIFTNGYPEVVTNAISGKAKVTLNKRPGPLASAALSGVGSGSNAGCIWSGNSVVPSPIVLVYSNSSGTSTSIWQVAGPAKIGGDIANTVACVSLTDTSISGVGNLVGFFLDSGLAALEAWYFPEGGAWTQITDADFPPNLGTPELLTGAPVHLNGRMYVMTTNGKIWNSDLNTLTNWTASAFNTAQSYPDGGVGLARYKNLIVAFGQYSIEFFQDVGLTPSPIVSIGNAGNRIGAIFPTSILLRTIFSVSNTVYFMGVNSETGTQGVYRLNGFLAEKVSNAAIDKLVNSGIILGFKGAFTLHGMSHILMNTTVTTHPIFCIETNTWWNLTAGVVPTTIVGALGNSYFAGSTAKLYTINAGAPVYQDDGVAYTMTAQLDNVDCGTTKRKIWKRIRPYGHDIQAAASNLSISYSDDDGANYSTARTIDLNSQSAIEQGLTRLGSSRRRSWKIEHAANTPYRGEGVEIDFEECSS